jgi:NADPH-dependent 2,4-dienoyl-CoA reductase/sulfur reductase-like enzyme
MTSRIIIAGAGLAGVSAAEALRAMGYGGAIKLFDDEGEWPYDRPPLSKAYPAGALEDHRCHLRPAEWYAAQGIELYRGLAVTGFDPAAHHVTTADGGRHEYDRLLLATGASARALPGLTASHPRLRYLRTIADARALRVWLRPGARAILIGGGVIGMECAATAAQAGCAVTVLEGGERIMARFFPSVMSDFLAERHRGAGVTIHTHFVVQRVVLTDSGVSVFGPGPDPIEGDFVIAGIGAAPNVTLAAAAGLRLVAGGIEVDESGRSSAPEVYAAGDCAAFPAPDGGHARWENWTHAAAHAQHVARAMVGAVSHYAAVPWVWSDQYDLNIQVTGRPDADQIVQRGDMQSGRFTLFHLVEGRVRGGTTVNNGRDKRPLAALVRAGAFVAAAALADPSVPLKALAPADVG